MNKAPELIAATTPSVYFAAYPIVGAPDPGFSAPENDIFVAKKTLAGSPTSVNQAEQTAGLILAQAGV